MAEEPHVGFAVRDPPEGVFAASLIHTDFGTRRQSSIRAGELRATYPPLPCCPSSRIAACSLVAAAIKPNLPALAMMKMAVIFFGDVHGRCLHHDICRLARGTSGIPTATIFHAVPSLWGTLTGN